MHDGWCRADGRQRLHCAQVLTTGFWPTYKVQDIDLPKEMLDSQAQFKVRNSMSMLMVRRCVSCGCSCPCSTLTVAIICADL